MIIDHDMKSLTTNAAALLIVAYSIYEFSANAKKLMPCFPPPPQL